MASSPPLQNFKYSDCLFQARLQKPSLFRLRKKQELYLYVSSNYIIINHEPYAKKPEIVLELLPTTHVRWLWQAKRTSFLRANILSQGKNNDNQSSSFQQLKGFIIETDGFVGEFIAEKVVMEMLKLKFKEIILQSDFYDEYTLGKYLDKGNYAMVYLCTKKQSGKQYAVKILQKERLKTMKNGKQSVFNELKILRKLNHPNLMKLFEVFEDRNKYYFVLQLLNGVTLYKQIQTRKKKAEIDLKPHQIRGILKQILEGIKYLHQENIMHRDLKPENILFEEKGCLQKNAFTGLKLVDYGLATFQHQKHIIFTKCGTPGFVAPQVIVYDERQPIYQTNVDVFSVGVIFHILLLGQQAFPGKSRNTILNKNKQAKIDFRAKKYEAIASDGLDLLSKMLQKNPEKRISAKQALEHPFLTKDKPIFKFKKSYKEQTVEMRHQTVQKYLNFDDIGTKKNENNSNSPNLHSRQGQIAQSQQQDELDAYDPFSYSINQFPSQADFDSYQVSETGNSIEGKSDRRKPSQSFSLSDGNNMNLTLSVNQTRPSQGRKNSLLQRKIINSYGQRDSTLDQKMLGNFFTYIP